MKYKGIAILLGAEAFQFDNVSVSVLSSSNTVQITCEVSPYNFEELLKAELPFTKDSDETYCFEVGYQAIIKLG